MKLPKVTFGMIVLNGEPFVHYNLRALYPLAHQIIIVEGAAPAATAIATRDGHSSDATLETIQRFQAAEDPEHKVILVTAEDEGHPTGFWPGEKDDQSQAYARRASGDYLWQVDVDEFYKPEDMRAILEMLASDHGIAAVSFKMITFWGSLDVVTDGWYLRRGAEIYHRLFKWGPGYQYKTHRPPTVIDPQGRDLRRLKWMSGYHLARRGIFLYHYSLLFPKQVIEKCEYYGRAAWAKRSGAQSWAEQDYVHLGNPFRVHNVYDYPSWLERFHGSHPPEIERMRNDIAAGRLNIAMRRTDDVERLLASRKYHLGILCLKLLDQLDRRWNGMRLRYRRRIAPFVATPARVLRKSWRTVQRLMSSGT